MRTSIIIGQMFDVSLASRLQVRKRGHPISQKSLKADCLARLTVLKSILFMAGLVLWLELITSHSAIDKPNFHFGPHRN
jgi:hypothetical protein